MLRTKKISIDATIFNGDKKLPHPVHLSDASASLGGDEWSFVTNSTTERIASFVVNLGQPAEDQRSLTVFAERVNEQNIL